MDKVKVKYTGHKAELPVQFPVPFVSKCEAEGPPVVFRRKVETEISRERAEQLMKYAPSIFEVVQDAPRTSSKA